MKPSNKLIFFILFCKKEISLKLKKGNSSKFSLLKEFLTVPNTFTLTN